MVEGKGKILGVERRVQGGNNKLLLIKIKEESGIERGGEHTDSGVRSRAA